MEARFPASCQTGRQVHPASYTMGTGSFPELKRPGCGVYHPPTSSAEVKQTVELYLYSPTASSRPVLRTNFTVPHTRCIRHTTCPPLTSTWCMCFPTELRVSELNTQLRCVLGHGPGVDSASNRNENQKSSLGVKEAGT